MKALIISPVAPYPLTEGHRKRIDFTTRILESRGYEITFVLFGWDWKLRDGEHEEIFAHCRERFADFHFVAADDHVGAPPAEEPVHAIDDWWSSGLEVFLTWLSKNDSFDLVLVNYVFLSRACELFSAASVRVIDTHDRFAERKTLFQKNNMRPEFFYTTNEDEAVGLDRADLVLAIKKSEAETFSHETKTPILVMPYYEETQPPVPLRAQGGKVRFGYFASSNSINKRNLDYFFEVLVKEWPGFGQICEVAVYGSVCKLLSPKDLPEGVVLEGFVETPREFYEAVDVVVIPQVFSTGLKIKVAEAMANGVPIIAHEHAWDGFPELCPWHSCPSLEEVARAMRGFAEAPERLEELRQATQDAQTRLIDDITGAADMLHSIVADIHDILIISGPAFQASMIYATHALQICNLCTHGTKRFKVMVLDAPDDPELRLLKRFGAVDLVPPGAAVPEQPQTFQRAICFADFPEDRIVANSRITLTSAIAFARLVASNETAPIAATPGPGEQILRLTGNPFVPELKDPGSGTLPGAFRWPPYRVPTSDSDLLIIAEEMSFNFRMRFSHVFPDATFLEWGDPDQLRGAYAATPTMNIGSILLLDDAYAPELDLLLDFFAVSGTPTLKLTRIQDVTGSYLVEYIRKCIQHADRSPRAKKPLGVRMLESQLLFKPEA